MPPRKSLTTRLLHHLLLLSLARVVLAVFGRGRAWDEWDEAGRKLDDGPEAAAAALPAGATPPVKRSRVRRFALALSFCTLFFAGLAFSAGAGDGVRGLLESDDTTSVAATSETDTTTTEPETTTTETERAAVEQSPEEQAARSTVRQVETPAPQRTAVVASRPPQAVQLARGVSEQPTGATASRRSSVGPGKHSTRRKASSAQRVHKHARPRPL